MNGTWRKSEWASFQSEGKTDLRMEGWMDGWIATGQAEAVYVCKGFALHGQGNMYIHGQLKQDGRTDGWASKECQDYWNAVRVRMYIAARDIEGFLISYMLHWARCLALAMIRAPLGCRTRPFLSFGRIRVV